MSKQPENEALTSQELHQALLSEIETSQQIICELSDEQLEQINGGDMIPSGAPNVINSGSKTHAVKHAFKYAAIHTVLESIIDTAKQVQ
jgi:bacteriocin-like protein